MAGHPRKLEEIYEYCVAFLAAERRSQKEIADTLQISQAAVSRLIGEAKRKGILQIEISFSSDVVPVDVMTEVVRRCSGDKHNQVMAEFCKHLGLKTGPFMRVFTSGDPVIDMRKRIELFAGNAAPHVRSLMLSCRSLGVTWGGMLRGIVTALGRSGFSSPWHDRRIDVIPLAGDPQSTDPADTGSSVISNDLTQIINGALPEPHHSLGMVPAIIPEDFSNTELKVVRKLIGKVYSYEQIFGRDRSGEKVKAGAVDRLDGIFTSVGPCTKPLGWKNSQLLERGGIMDELPNLVYGDVGGVLIPRDHLSEDQRLRLEETINRWTGLTLQELKGCFQRVAADRSKVPIPGVVAICVGADRADFIFDLMKSRAAKGGLINHLVVDQNFADRFLHRVDEYLKSKPVPSRRKADATFT